MSGIVLNTREPIMSKSRQSTCTQGACCLAEVGEADMNGMIIRKSTQLHSDLSAL